MTRTLTLTAIGFMLVVSSTLRAADVELASTSIHFGFGTLAAAPPLGVGIAYGLFPAGVTTPGEGLAMIYDRVVLLPSTQSQSIDLARADDPDFDAVASAVEAGLPPDTHFGSDSGFVPPFPAAATSNQSGPETLLAVPPNACVHFFRLTVPPFAIAQPFPPALFFEVSPFFVQYRLAAIGSYTAAGADTDGDGLLDDDETLVYGTNPCRPDTDRDGLPDGAEVSSAPFGTDPLDPDSDDDGVLDGPDNCPAAFYETTGHDGYNPDQLDADGDGIGDVCDPDDDNDGVPDVRDACPLSGTAGFDSNSDGCRDTLAGFVTLVVTTPDIPDAVRRNLLAKIDEVAHLLCTNGNVRAARQKLGDVQSYLEAQSGKKLGTPLADLLEAYVVYLVAEITDGIDVCGEPV